MRIVASLADSRPIDLGDTASRLGRELLSAISHAGGSHENRDDASGYRG